MTLTDTAIDTLLKGSLLEPPPESIPGFDYSLSTTPSTPPIPPSEPIGATRSTPAMISELNESQLTDLYQKLYDPDPGHTPSRLDKVANTVSSGVRTIGSMVSDAPKAWAVAMKVIQSELDREGIKSISARQGDRDIRDMTAWQLGQRLEDTLNEYVPGDPRLAKSMLWEQIPSGLTSAAYYVLGGGGAQALKLGTRGTLAFMSALAAPTGMADQYEAAKQAGASEGEAQIAALLGGAIETSQIIPASRILNRFNKASGGAFVHNLGDVLKSGAVGSIYEGIQEGLAGLGHNAVAKIYEKERDMFDTVLEQGQIGGIVGFTVDVMANMLGLKKGRARIRKDLLSRQGVREWAELNSEQAAKIKDAADAKRPITRSIVGKDVATVLGKKDRSDFAALVSEQIEEVQRAQVLPKEKAAIERERILGQGGEKAGRERIQRQSQAERAEAVAETPQRQAQEMPEVAESLTGRMARGEALETIGATSSPNYEVGPKGDIRVKASSAKDLVGEDVPKNKTVKSEYASPNTEFETGYQRSQGIGKRGFSDKWRAFWGKMAELTTRGALPKLPRTKQFGEARSAFQAYNRAPGVASATGQSLIERTVKPLSSDDYDLFNRKVVLGDLAATEGELPWGLTPEATKAELDRINAHVANNPRVQASLEYRRLWFEKMQQDYIDAHKPLGIDLSDRFQRENYFRHQVLTYMRLREGIGVGGKGVGVQTQRSWLKERKGSVLDINSNYVEAEYEIATQMVADTLRAKALVRLKSQYDILPQLRAQAKEAGTDWRKLIPEGYQEMAIQPGRHMFLTHSIPESLAQRAMEAAGEEIGLTSDQIRQVLAMGQKHAPFVVPNAIAEQAEYESKKWQTPPVLKEIDHALTYLVGQVKRWQLQGPTRVVGYNLRNMGEADKVLSLNPSSAQYVPKAIVDLAQYYTGRENVPLELLEWVERGGGRTLMRVNELGEVSELKKFERLINKPKTTVGKVAKTVTLPWRKYWETVGLGTDMRESILRYATYLDYTSQISSSPEGKPNNYGSSIPAEVDGIVDPRDKAFRLSADILVDYSDISILGQFLRSRVYPYWSFQEGNLRAYWNGIRNLARQEDKAIRVGRKIAKTLGLGAAAHAPFMLYRLGRIAILLYGAQLAYSLFSNLFFPEEEEEIPKDVRKRHHLTIRAPDGSPAYFTRIGTASDFLEWLGAEGVYTDVKDILDHRRTLKEVANDMIASPVNKLVNGVNPLIKVPGEIAAGKTLFPDVRDPRTIRDRWEHLARIIGVEKEYKAAVGLPQQKGARGLKYLTGFSKTEPGQAAYYEILDLKDRFFRSIGRGRGEGLGPRTDALRNFKLAVRYGDERAKKKYLAEYASLGGTRRGLQQSLAAMEPLWGLSRKTGTLQAFYATLTEEDRDTLEKAYEFYRTVLLGQGERQ